VLDVVPKVESSDVLARMLFPCCHARPSRRWGGCHVECQMRRLATRLPRVVVGTGARCVLVSFSIRG